MKLVHANPCYTALLIRTIGWVTLRSTESCFPLITVCFSTLPFDCRVNRCSTWAFVMNDFF
jgi:hypothetical protein